MRKTCELASSCRAWALRSFSERLSSSTQLFRPSQIFKTFPSSLQTYLYKLKNKSKLSNIIDNADAVESSALRPLSRTASQEQELGETCAAIAATMAAIAYKPAVSPPNSPSHNGRLHHEPPSSLQRQYHHLHRQHF